MQEQIQTEENKVVYLKINNQGYMYECVGVLVMENEDIVQIAFNAVNDKVMDQITFNKSDIMEMRECKPDLLK